MRKDGNRDVAQESLESLPLQCPSGHRSAARQRTVRGGALMYAHDRRRDAATRTRR
jgi:hypothetical protein